MTESLLALVAATTFTASVFMVLTALWLKKLKANIRKIVAESASLQVRQAKNLGEKVEYLQNQSRAQDDKIRLLTLANKRLHHDLVVLAQRLQPSESETPTSSNERTLH